MNSDTRQVFPKEPTALLPFVGGKAMDCRHLFDALPIYALSWERIFSLVGLQFFSLGVAKTFSDSEFSFLKGYEFFQLHPSLYFQIIINFFGNRFQ